MSDIIKNQRAVKKFMGLPLELYIFNIIVIAVGLLLSVANTEEKIENGKSIPFGYIMAGSIFFITLCNLKFPKQVEED